MILGCKLWLVLQKSVYPCEVISDLKWRRNISDKCFDAIWHFYEFIVLRKCVFYRNVRPKIWYMEILYASRVSTN